MDGAAAAAAASAAAANGGELVVRTPNGSAVGVYSASGAGKVHSPRLTPEAGGGDPLLIRVEDVMMKESRAPLAVSDEESSCPHKGEVMFMPPQAKTLPPAGTSDATGRQGCDHSGGGGRILV